MFPRKSRAAGVASWWSFSTRPVHGGFSDGDLIYSGSSITAITNWQDMQINDPARDLAWVFAKLDETHRNAVITAYGRVLGNRLDDLIMLRANLWVQMEQVGAYRPPGLRCRRDLRQRTEHRHREHAVA